MDYIVVHKHFPPLLNGHCGPHEVGLAAGLAECKRKRCDFPGDLQAEAAHSAWAPDSGWWGTTEAEPP